VVSDSVRQCGYCAARAVFHEDGGCACLICTRAAECPHPPPARLVDLLDPNERRGRGRPKGRKDMVPRDTATVHPRRDLARALQAAGYTRYEIADRLGVHTSHVAKLLRARP
jgi:hypothetical protein